jgi:hypothetical protein
LKKNPDVEQFQIIQKPFWNYFYFLPDGIQL